MLERLVRQPVLAGAIVFASATLAHLPALWTSFVADDFTLLRTVRRTTGVAWAFTHNDLGEGAGHFYRPLWVLWHTGIFELFGRNAVVFHAASLVVFGVIAIEVWLLARRFLAPPPAFVAALGFAVYPRHAESVAWVSGSTDLLATAFMLASLLCLLQKWPTWARAAGAGVFAGGAALCKESAFVLPVLGALVLWLGRRDRLRNRGTWLPLGVLTGAQVVVLAVRSTVLDGAGGGYTEYPWRPHRAVAVAVSDVIAAASPPALPVLRQPAWLTVPLLAIAVFAWVTWRVWRKYPDRRRVIALGFAWCAVTLAPTLNLAVDLNNANGERFLFMPSIGFAFVFGALLGPIGRRSGLILSAAAAVAVVLCIHNTQNWVAAGEIAERTINQATVLGPRNGELILLSVPASYRTARVLQVGLDAAVEEAGRPDLTISTCLPVQVYDRREAKVAFERGAERSFRGETTWAAPFDFPFLRSSLTAGLNCSYKKVGGGRWPPGLGTRGEAFSAPGGKSVELVFFDGHDLRPCCP